MCDDAGLEGSDAAVVSTVVSTLATTLRGARGFVFFTGRVVTDRFGAAFLGVAFFGAVFLGATFFVAAFFGAAFFEAVFLVETFFGVLVAGCFLTGFLTVFLAVFPIAFLTVFFLAAFLAVFGARAFVVAFALVFLRLAVFFTAVLPRVLAAGLRPVAAERGLRGFTRGFLAVFFLAGATTNSL